MYTHKVTALILHIEPHRDKDRIVTLFSEEHGIIRIFAKGVTSIRSRRGFHLDLFNLVTMQLEQTGVHAHSLRPRYLREVSTANPHSDLKKSLPHFGAACTIASFLMRILPYDTPQTELFTLTKTGFMALNEDDEPRGMLFSYFKETMQLLGYLPKNLPEEKVREVLWQRLTELDPQFTLNARRTLGIFSKFESTRSS